MNRNYTSYPYWDKVLNYDYPCPYCAIRFSYQNDLTYHLAQSHRPSLVGVSGTYQPSLTNEVYIQKFFCPLCKDEACIEAFSGTAICQARMPMTEARKKQYEEAMKPKKPVSRFTGLIFDDDED